MFLPHLLAYTFGGIGIKIDLKAATKVKYPLDTLFFAYIHELCPYLY